MYLGLGRVYKRARERMLVMLVHTEEAGNETCVSNVRKEQSGQWDMGASFIRPFSAVFKTDYTPLDIMILHILICLTGFEHRHTLAGTYLERYVNTVIDNC